MVLDSFVFLAIMVFNVDLIRVEMLLNDFSSKALYSANHSNAPGVEIFQQLFF